jgi:hypothetical protein
MHSTNEPREKAMGTVDNADRLPPIGFPDDLFTVDLDRFPVTQRLVALLSVPSVPSEAATKELERLVERSLTEAYGDSDPEALQDVHQALFAIYETSFANPLSPACRHEHAPWLVALREVMERTWIRHDIGELTLPSEPMSSEALGEWFIQAAAEQSPLDEQVVRHLEETASIEEMRIFVAADAYLNYRFFDALVLSLLHYLESVKCEISEHFWEESGEGSVGSSHTRQFTRTLEKLEVTPGSLAVWDDWRPFAGHNLYFCLGLGRRHYFKALGSLAMPELFDVARDQSVVNGFKRLGFDPEHDFEYYWNHVEADAEHGPGWLSGVILGVAEAQPEAIPELMLGGGLRMQAMQRFNEYLADRFELAVGAA